MVLIESKKYACETCIKGHRSSGCKHTDRPLYEIKKKGRPVTQCEHCRELRKTKQVHVKCSCKGDASAGVEQASSFSKKDVNKMLESAAFPNGLPEALEASVASQLLSQGAISDSDHDGCSCLSTGDECHCCTPRKTAPRTGKQGMSTSKLPLPHSSTAPRSSESPKPPNASNAVHRVSELRPLLPKPAHDPSSVSAGGRHDAKLYSPYGRAYEQSHPNHPVPHNPYPNSSSTQSNNNPQDSSLPISSHALSSLSTSASHTARPGLDSEAWNSFRVTDDIVGSLCGCGGGCTCPNCIIHKRDAKRAGPNVSVCSQPDACRGCIDCAASLTYQSSQRDSPPDTTLSMYNNTYPFPQSDDSSSIDEWIRQMQGSIPSFSAPDNEGPIGSDSSPGDSFRLPLDVSNYRDLSPHMPIDDARQSTFMGRSRSSDDILSSTFSNLDPILSLELPLFNASLQDRTQGYLSNSTFQFEGPQHVPSIPAGLDLGGAVPVSRSASKTPSSEESWEGGKVSSAGLGEMSSMSMFYNHSGIGAGGGRSSVKSLPDTLGYF